MTSCCIYGAFFTEIHFMAHTHVIHYPLSIHVAIIEVHQPVFTQSSLRDQYFNTTHTATMAIFVQVSLYLFGNFCHSFCVIFIFFIPFFFFLLTGFKKSEGEKRGREREIDVRETHCSVCLPYAPQPSVKTTT